MSSSISVFIGMGIIAATIGGMFGAVSAGLSNIIIILIFTGVFALIYGLLLLILSKICDKSFDNINV